MSDLSRTVVSLHTGTVTAVINQLDLAYVDTAAGLRFSMDRETLICPTPAQVGVGSDVPKPGIGDAFVNLATIKTGDVVSFGGSPYGYIPVVYSPQGHAVTGRKAPTTSAQPQLKT